jgi:hypothetical protein
VRELLREERARPLATTKLIHSRIILYTPICLLAFTEEGLALAKY